LVLMRSETLHKLASIGRTQGPFNFDLGTWFLGSLLKAGEYLADLLFQLAKIRGFDKVGLCSPGHKFLLIMPW
jgi:hypothetical protein